jgi:hypothetical protein
LIYKSHIYIFAILICALSVFSQNFSSPNGWKKYSKEVIGSIGGSGFLGDLGGRNKIGKDYSPVDLELAATRPAISLAFRYKLYKNINVHSSLNYLRLSGDDRLTKDIYRNNRNLNFKSNIFELSSRIEFGISSIKSLGIFGLKNKLPRKNISRSYELIGFIGFGVFYFNPKGKDPNTGKYIALKPLHTEGQGLPGGPKQYKRVSISLPIGIAFHAILNRLWSVGLEFSYRKTFTDYIDDVSTTYYNNALIKESYGLTAATLADPSKGDIPGASSPNGDGTGAQRGDKEKDSFMSLQVTVGRFLFIKRTRTKLSSKF